MFKKFYKKIILGSFFASVILGITKTAMAISLILDYPDIGGSKPGQEGFGLPDLARYIYLFSLGIVGVVALLSMIIGAAQYVMSAGNPSKASDAKDRIYSAILGIIILIASVLILRTINPDLVNLGIK